MPSHTPMSLSAFPSCHLINFFPFAARFPWSTCPLHPNSYGQSLVRTHGLPTLYWLMSKVPLTAAPCSTCRSTAPCQLPLSWDLVGIWKRHCCIWTHSGYFCTFFLSPSDLGPLTPFYTFLFYFSPLSLSLRHCLRHRFPPPPLSARPTLCKILPFSKFSGYSDTATRCPQHHVDLLLQYRIKVILSLFPI